MSQELMIFKMRKDRKISQQELADNLSINRSLMSQIETGKVLPTFNMLLEIARTLNCLVTDLYHREEIKNMKGGE